MGFQEHDEEYSSYDEEDASDESDSLELSKEEDE